LASQARKSGKSRAYKAVIDFAYAHMDILSLPDTNTGFVALSLKDLMAMIREMEEALRGDDGGERNPLDVVRDWLNGAEG
jgi:hypothetical protein